MKTLIMITFALCAILLSPTVAHAQLLVDECCDDMSIDPPQDWNCSFLECCHGEDCADKYGGWPHDWECMRGICNVAGIYYPVSVPVTAVDTVRTWIAQTDDEEVETVIQPSACSLAPAP